MSSAIPLYEQFLSYLFSSGGITVPTDYHSRCAKISLMLDNETSGLINTILDYSVSSASEATYGIECNNETLEKLLNQWLQKININVNGIPTGLQALSKEYFKERWEGSSFCILRVRDWEPIAVDGVTLKVPTTMWFVNGSSIYVKRPKTNNYKLGTDTYYLDKDYKLQIPSKADESIVVQKPYNRWFDKYATPYLIRKGVYKNWLAVDTLQGKSNEVISKVLPYLFLMEKGDKDLFLQGVDYKNEDLKEMVDNFKTEYEKYISEQGKTPAHGIPFDQKYSHLIPDLRSILSEELYRQGFRSILSGLGFVDMIEIAPSRQENRLNPKPFITEVNDGISGFKSILSDVINIIRENNNSHRKLFSDTNEILITNSPIRINVDQLLDSLRSGYDRGICSIQSYQEVLGLNYDKEKERRIKERNEGDEELFYPHLITNNEDKGIDIINPSKPRTKKQENLENENKTGPEKNNYKNASLVICQHCGHEFDYDKTPEAGMGWVKCPKCGNGVTQESGKIINKSIDSNLNAVDKKELEEAPYDKNNPPDFLKKYPKGAQEIFIKIFNESIPKGEDYAFPVAWSALKRWLKKNGYKKVNDKWVKSEEMKNEQK